MLVIWILVEVFFTRVYCAMPHKIVVKVYGVQSPSVQVPLELYVVSYIPSAFKFCADSCCRVVAAIIVWFLLQLCLGSCGGSRLAGLVPHLHTLLGSVSEPENLQKVKNKLDTSDLGAI